MKCSHWDLINSRFPQGSSLGPFFFLVYVNDLADNLNCFMKLFADDTSLFSLVRDVANTSLELYKDLESVSLWDWQLKMLFNVEKTKRSYIFL